MSPSGPLEHTQIMLIIRHFQKKSTWVCLSLLLEKGYSLHLGICSGAETFQYHWVGGERCVYRASSFWLAVTEYPPGCRNNKGGFVDWADIFSQLYSRVTDISIFCWVAHDHGDVVPKFPFPTPNLILSVTTYLSVHVPTYSGCYFRLGNLTRLREGGVISLQHQAANTLQELFNAQPWLLDPVLSYLLSVYAYSRSNGRVTGDVQSLKNKQHLLSSVHAHIKPLAGILNWEQKHLWDISMEMHSRTKKNMAKQCKYTNNKHSIIVADTRDLGNFVSSFGRRVEQHPGV